ncbi:sacsin-like [Astyanax mexicanus]|uniref:Sacsin-like n=1 Tax=Astyanax mexicanus TaxID=7994 RepID=A0A8T2LLN7_ASTMX|nr:sacsin-like [Astyanax mexicanus]
MQNLRNICQHLSKSDVSVDTRAAVFSNSYAYLQSVDFDASALADLPLVLTENDTTLVKATQAVLSLPHSNDFRPYLYPIQSNHVKYAKFFKKIGVKEKPTITQLCTVLQEIYQECSDKITLHPNQQTTVKRVVKQIFQLIKEDKTCNFHDNTLYLPSTDGKLYESNTLFFNDTVFRPKRLEDPLRTKLKLLENLNHCHLGNDPYEHQKLLQLLPQNIRPKLLTQVISENLVGAHAEQCEYGKRCEFSGWFEQHLSSRAFRHGLICLIREQSEGSISQTEATRMCENIFGKIQIICCSALQTELLLHQEPLEGTRSRTQVYVKKQQEASIFYLKHSDDMDFEVVNEVIMHLTKEINGLLNNRLNSFMLPILGHLLLCKNLENVERTLEQQGIHNSMTEEGGFGTRPDPGDPIPEEWIDSLDMNPFNCFEKGEYVGFQKDELKNEYRFAIIVECLDELSGQNRRIPARYKIQIGTDEFIEVSSLDLYQFKREQSTPMTFSSCTEIAVMPKPSESTSSPRIPTPQHEPKERHKPQTPEERPKPQTLDEVKVEIDQYLKEIWKMSEEDKCKAIKRLYLRWHPDKNLDNPDLANEAFKYLQNRIKELEGGKTEGSISSGGDHFRESWSRWNEEARRHRRGRERFYQNNSRRHYNFWSYFTPRDMPNPDIPDREEAKRWYRQAECDLSAAQSEPAASPEWKLFKVHQAVEKALIASEYRRKGRPSRNVSITGLAQQISHYSPHLSEVPRAVAQLRTLGVDAKKTQYPNCHPPPRIPHDQFRHEDAREAVKIAAELLKNPGLEMIGLKVYKIYFKNSLHS